MPYEVRGKCVYKKNTGKKVGCTDGDVKKYLAALHANEEKKMKSFTKSDLIEIIKEELKEALQDRDGPEDDRAEIQDEAERLYQLVNDVDFEHDGFLISLVREAGKYLPPREDQLEEKIKQAIVGVLLRG